ncbi:MAG: NAD(P)/FAD-dependent oxidoreductase, partial [Thermodesulfobacteriota bacterium]
MLNKIKQNIENKVETLLSLGTGDRQRPQINKNFESNIPGLYIIGDLAGAPVIKLAMEQGFNVINYIASLSDAKPDNPDIYDVVVVGAGASGLNAALTAKDQGLKCIVLEKGKIANTIENFPEGKWVYAEPDKTPPKGKLWLDGAQKEDLINRWNQIIDTNDIDVRLMEPLEEVRREKDIFEVKTPKSTFKTKRIVLATGMRGNPRKLEVPGEDSEKVYHQLYSPRKYNEENIMVVGGGNSAIEAAITLSDQNKVYLSYRKGEFARIFKDNERLLNEKVASGKIELVLN